MTDRSLLLNDVRFERPALARTIQALVFFSDCIYVRASSEYRGQNEEGLRRRVDELQEHGLVATWAHEYEVDRRGYVASRAAGRSARRRPLVVVPQDEVVEGLAEMDGYLRMTREQAYGRGQRQGVTEIARLRHHLACLVLASELEADGLLATRWLASDLGNARAPADDDLGSQIVGSIVRDLQLGDLSWMSIDDIVRCRRHMLDFRTELEHQMVAMARGFDPRLSPERTATDLVARYRMALDDYLRDSPMRELRAEATWDVLGSTLPPSIVLK